MNEQKKEQKKEINAIQGADGKWRCPWAGDDPQYVAYHDEEWGRPLYDSDKLYELLCLEGMQAGLSWITVLRKRENFRRAFAGFDPEVVARFDERKQAELKQDAGIIRNGQKIAAIVANAKAVLALRDAGKSFSDYLWETVDGEAIQNHWVTTAEVPAATDLSEALSKRLKQDGFKFVGGTIAYAFMQASGMVNDHLVSCYCHQICYELSYPPSGTAKPSDTGQ